MWMLTPQRYVILPIPMVQGEYSDNPQPSTNHSNNTAFYSSNNLDAPNIYVENPPSSHSYQPVSSDDHSGGPSSDHYDSSNQPLSENCLDKPQPDAHSDSTISNYAWNFPLVERYLAPNQLCSFQHPNYGRPLPTRRQA